MIIPEDGCLPQITKKGFAAFNNVMLIKVPEKLKKPGETIFQLATLDRSKKGERWPADQYVNEVMKTPPEENGSTENSTNFEKESNQNSYTTRNGKFLKKFKPYSKKSNNFSEKNHERETGHSDPAVVPTDTANLNHEYMPNSFHDSQVPPRRFHGENHVQYNERTFNDDPYSYRYHQNKFPSDHQPYGVHNLHAEGTSLNHIEKRYGAQGKITSATVSREPTIGNRPYNDDFDPQNPPSNQHNLISPIKRPFDFQENPQPYIGPYVINPQENNFNGTEVSPNFIELGRRNEDSFIPNNYSTNNYPIENYNEVPRNGNLFPHNHSNRPEFNNNFELPLGVGPNNGFNNHNNSRDNIPLLPSPHLPFDNFNKVPKGNFPNFNGMNSLYHQEPWEERGQPNTHYPRKNRNDWKFNQRRGRGSSNRFFRGNNNRRANNRYQRNKS